MEPSPAVDGAPIISQFIKSAPIGYADVVGYIGKEKLRPEASLIDVKVDFINSPFAGMRKEEMPIVAAPGKSIVEEAWLIMLHQSVGEGK